MTIFGQCYNLLNNTTKYKTPKQSIVFQQSYFFFDTIACEVNIDDGKTNLCVPFSSSRSDGDILSHFDVGNTGLTRQIESRH